MSENKPTEVLTNLEQEVFDICDRLYANKEKITVRYVMSLLESDIKSTSTIHKPVAKWRKLREAELASLRDKMGFSPAFATAFTEEVTRYTVEAEARYKRIADEAEQQSREAIDDLSIQDEKYYKQSKLVEQLEGKLKDLESDVKKRENDAKISVQELRGQIEILQEENRTLDDSCDRLRTELAKTEVKTEHDKELVDSYKTQVNKLEEDNARLQNIVTSQSSEISTSSAKRESELQLFEYTKQSLAKVESNVEEQKAQINELSGKLAELISSEQKHKDKLLSQSELVGELRNSQANLTNQLTKEQETVVELKEQLSQIKSKNAD